MNIECNAAELNVGLNDGAGERVGRRGHAGIDGGRGASQTGGPDDDGIARVNRIGGSDQLAVIGAGAAVYEVFFREKG